MDSYEIQSNIRALVLVNLSNELRKSDNISDFITFPQLI